MCLRSLWITFVVLCWTATSQAAIVYNNIGSPSNPGDPQLVGSLKGSDFALTHEFGDEVSLLTPGARAFESAIIAYRGSGFGGGETLTLNLRAMDGAPTPGSFGFNTPGTLLFTQTVAISNGDNQALFFNGMGETLLPDGLTVGLVFDGIGDFEDYEIPLFDPPAVGSSFTDYWTREPGIWSDDWSLRSGIIPGFDPTRVVAGPSLGPHVNFGINISAVEGTPVPEPTSMFLVGSAMCTLAAFRRRLAR